MGAATVAGEPVSEALWVGSSVGDCSLVGLPDCEGVSLGSWADGSSSPHPASTATDTGMRANRAAKRARAVMGSMLQGTGVAGGSYLMMTVRVSDVGPAPSAPPEGSSVMTTKVYSPGSRSDTSLRPVAQG